MKKKTLVPLVIFLLGICLVSLIVYITDTHENEQRHITAQLNATTYGERIKTEITDGIEITDALKQILISENGEIRQFETIAENLISDSIESVQLAQNGVDGTYLSVLDHGRIVDSQQHGRVFYVLFMDWEDMYIRYNKILKEKMKDNNAYIK